MRSRLQRLDNFGFGVANHCLAGALGAFLLLAPSAGDALAQGREPPAKDLVCQGCVDTSDLANGSVTKAKLAKSVLDGITPTIPNGSITAEKLQNGIISTDKLGDAAVTGDKLQNGAVVKGKIGRAAVLPINIKNKAITTGKIKDGAVTASKLGVESVDASKIAPNAVNGSKIAPNSITSVHIATDAVGSDEIGANAVGSAEIANNAVGSQHIANDAVGFEEISANAVGSSELAINAVGSQHIAANAVGADEIANNAVGAPEIAANAVGASEIAANAVGASELANNAISAQKLAPDSVGASEIAANAVGSSELQEFVTMGTTTASGAFSVFTSVTDRNAVQILTNSAGGGFFQTSGVTANPSIRMNTFGDGAGFFEVMDKNGTTVAGISGANGDVFGKTKSFLVDDPNDDSRMIRYTSIEGAEAAIYARGTAELEDGWTVIDLPEHFTALVDPESMSVSLTPRSATSLGLAAIDVQADAVEVWELQGGAGSYEFDYVIYGQRKGYENYQVYLYKDPDEAMLTASFEVDEGKLGLEDFPAVPRGVDPVEPQP